jgi:hypothetical protein
MINFYDFRADFLKMVNIMIQDINRRSFQMNSAERIAACFRKEKTDRIPVHHIGFSSKAVSQLMGREVFVGGGIQRWREAKAKWEGWHEEFKERSFKDAMVVAEFFEQDIIRPQYWGCDMTPTGKIDENTYEFKNGPEENWHILRYDPQSEQANFSHMFPRETTLEDLKNQLKETEKELAAWKPQKEDISTAVAAKKETGGKIPIRVGGVGIGIPLDDPVWFEAALLDPGLVKEYIQLRVEKIKKLVPFLKKHGFRYFFGGGDFASNSGPMYSPKIFKELILPGLKQVSEICHKHGGYHLFASDGNLWPVAEYLFGESGVDGYYEVDRRAGMDLKKLREKYPHLTLLGNISTWTMSQGTREDVKKEIMDSLETARKYSGIIVGVSNYPLPETPVENMEVLLETLKKHR